MDYIFIQQVPDGFTFARVHATGDRSYSLDALQSQMLSKLHQAQNVPEFQKINLLLGFERVPLEEADDLLDVLKFPNSQFPTVLVVLAHDAATEEPLQRMEDLEVPHVLDDAKFRNDLITDGGLRIALDAYEEAAFAVHKTDHPFRSKFHSFDNWILGV